MGIYNSLYILTFVSFIHQTIKKKYNAGSYLKKKRISCVCVFECATHVCSHRKKKVLYLWLNFCVSTKHMFLHTVPIL